MGKAPARAVTDNELLSGEDNSLDQLDDRAGEQDEDEIIGAQTTPDLDDDNIEVVILDEDEGKDKSAKGAIDDATQADIVEDDDTGEEVDTDEPLGELTDWEKKNYSKAMQSRILRERRIRERSVAQGQQQAVAAAHAVKAAKTEALEAQKLSTALLVQVLAQNIAAKQTEMFAAKEAGESQTEVKLLAELSDLQGKKRDVEAAKERLDRVKIEDPEAQQIVQSSPDTQAWLSRNRWFTNKQFGPEVSYTRSIDIDLAKAHKAGRFAHAPGTAQYFVELDKRIHARMPALRAQIKKTYGEPRRPAVAPVSRGVQLKPSNKVTLSRVQLENMVNFGLDPKNPAHLKAYARQVRDGATHE